MIEEPVFDARRSDSIRAALFDTVRETPRRRVRANVVTFASLAASVVVIAGGTGYALMQTGHHSNSQSPVAIPTTAAPQTPGPTPAPSTTGTPGVVNPAGTPSATPVPTLDVNDSNSWKISFEGIGPAVFGEPMATLKSTLASTPYAQDMNGVCPNGDVPAFNLSGGLHMTASEFRSADLLEYVEIAANPQATGTNAGPRTSTGMGVGATLAQLQAAYPDLVHTTTQDLADFYTVYGVTDRAGHWINFAISVDTHTVETISVTGTSMIAYELCG